MSEIKTVRGYINAVRRLSNNTTMYLKDFDKLNKNKKEILGVISAELSNLLGEFELVGVIDVVREDCHQSIQEMDENE